VWKRLRMVLIALTMHLPLAQPAALARREHLPVPERLTTDPELIN
jgi:hypothetical protein